MRTSIGEAREAAETGSFTSLSGADLGAQFCSGVVRKWRARQDETGHSYVIVISIV